MNGAKFWIAQAVGWPAAIAYLTAPAPGPGDMANDLRIIFGWLLAMVCFGYIDTLAVIRLYRWWQREKETG